MACLQQTSESLNPTTTFWPDAATVVSLSVFCADVPSSARQLTWTFPLALGSAAQAVPWWLDAVLLATPLPRIRTRRSPEEEIRWPWPYQAGRFAFPVVAETPPDATAWPKITPAEAARTR
jgi:hypothetical protein